MDTSGYFISTMVFIGIFYVVIYEIIKDQMKKKKTDDQNKWRKNITNFPKHNR